MSIRIGAGHQKGRLLRVPARAATRPTSSRVRAALFNILGDRVINAMWLDLYAGSGIIGLEALCRGAAWATFVDAHPEASRCISRNIQTLGFADRTQVWNEAVERYLRHNRWEAPVRLQGRFDSKGKQPVQMRSVIPSSQPQAETGPARAALARRHDHRLAASRHEAPRFDLVFADPPYRGQSGTAAISRLLPMCRDSGKIAPYAWLIVEHAASFSTPPGGAGWCRVRTYTYGDSALTIYRPDEPTPQDHDQ